MILFVLLLAVAIAVGMYGYNRLLAKPCNC